MTANRQHYRNARIADLFAQVLDLPNAGMNVVVIDAFDDTDGKRFHVASGHAAIGVQALVDNDECAGALIQFGIVRREEAADVDHRALLR